MGIIKKFRIKSFKHNTITINILKYLYHLKIEKF